MLSAQRVNDISVFSLPQSRKPRHFLSGMKDSSPPSREASKQHTLNKWWASVADDGSALNQHCFNILCLLGRSRSQGKKWRQGNPGIDDFISDQWPADNRQEMV